MANRPLSVSVQDQQGKPSLPADALFITSLTATEGISQLFVYELYLFTPKNAPIAFDKVLGQQITVTLDNGSSKSYLRGICNTFSEGMPDGTRLVYRATVVPPLWLLSRRVRSRVFDHQSVPDILDVVLKPAPMKYAMKLLDRSKYPAHDFCTQYSESDLNFVCRLMEEEGIYYFFEHLEGGTTMVLADAAGNAHSDVNTPLLFGPGRSIGVGGAEPNRVFNWEKGQQLRSSKYTLIDHHFEHQNPIYVSTPQTPPATVGIGSVTHKLSLLPADFGIAEYPGEYAHRFDDVNLSGGASAKGITQITTDKDRTAKLRLEQDVVSGLTVRGTSTCTAFSAGKTFKITDNANANGKYLLVSVTQSVSQPDEASGSGAISYQNGFTAIPFNAALPFRAPRLAPKPFIAGTQTAVVVGLDSKASKEQEILTDKFGRVKVRFHWDREDGPDAECSCWVRVAQVWAGKRWGATFWPRIGQEVIVSFLEGDPDQPIIVGSVYNAEQMPPYLGDGLDSNHKNDNKVSGIKSNSTLGGEGFNEWRFDDTKGKEEIFIHAQRELDVRVNADSIEAVGNNRSLIVGGEKDGKKFGDQMEKVYQDKHLHVLRNQEEHIEGNFRLTIGHGSAETPGSVAIVIEKNKFELIEGQDQLHVKGNQALLLDSDYEYVVGGDELKSVAGTSHSSVTGDVNEKVGGTQSLNGDGDFQHKVGGNYALDGASEIHLKGGTKIIIEAATQLSLVVGGNFIDISSSGISIVGSMVKINSGGSAGSGSACSPTAPDAPKQAKDAPQAKPVDPAVADDSKSGQKSASG